MSGSDYGFVQKLSEGRVGVRIKFHPNTPSTPFWIQCEHSLYRCLTCERADDNDVSLVIIQLFGGVRGQMNIGSEVDFKLVL